MGKGAILVGGAAGNGIVYKPGDDVGNAGLRQVTAGFQMDAWLFRETVLYNTEEAFNRFVSNTPEPAAQGSAVAAIKGASLAAEYTNGVMVYTRQKGGFVYEASIGGQKFE